MIDILNDRAKDNSLLFEIFYCKTNCQLMSVGLSRQQQQGALRLKPVHIVSCWLRELKLFPLEILYFFKVS